MQPRHSRRSFLGSVGAACALSVAGCVGGGDDTGTLGDIDPVESEFDLTVEHDIENWAHYDPDWEPPDSSPLEADLETEPVVENLEIPWDVSFGSDGEFFLSERVGRISHYAAGELEAVTEPADVIDHATAIDHDDEGGWWDAGGEGGLLGIALHPNYPDVPVVYAYYTYVADTGDEETELRNRLVLFEVTDDEPRERVIVDDVPGDNYHNGARLAFGPRNYLWVTMGDAGREELASDPGTIPGSVLRMRPDGTAPSANPGFDEPRVFSYGHRNPQGLSWLPDGTPVATEHGPSARDEVLVLEAGGDFGWPTVRGGPDDDGYGSYAAHDDVVNPLVNTGPVTGWAPSGGVFYTGDAVPALTNRFVVGGLAGQRLYVVTVYEGEAPDVGGTRYDADWLHPEYDAVVHELFADDLGRIRHVEQGPNGELYAITSNRDGRADEPFPVEGDDRLVRIVQP